MLLEGMDVLLEQIREDHVDRVHPRCAEKHEYCEVGW